MMRRFIILNEVLSITAQEYAIGEYWLRYGYPQ